MFAAFISRKLFDSGKISQKLQNQALSVIKYPSNGEKIHALRRLSPERFFHLEGPTKGTIVFRNLCNQIIHSYIFMLIMENGLKYFWVASDYNKFKFMYQIDVKEYAQILMKIGKYWPTETRYEFDEKKHDYRIIHS